MMYIDPGTEAPALYSPALWKSLVQHFCVAASAAPYGVRTFSRPDHFENFVKHRGGLTRGERVHLRKGYAFSIRRLRTPADVYANFPIHASVQDLVESAAHEVVHLRWPSLWGCGKKTSLFARRENALLEGYRCGPPGSPLPAAFR